MGKNVVEIEKQAVSAKGLDIFGAHTDLRPGKRSTLRTILATAAATVLIVGAIAGIGAFFYWRHLESTPQYTLALIIDAAKRNDDKTVNELVDIDAVVDDFLPQITGKAVELYGRNLPPDTLERVEQIAAPVLPAVKQRAREELPGAIRKKTETFGNVPFAAMVVGADTYLDIKVEKDQAMVQSKVPDHNFEVRMVRYGQRWKIAGLQDDELATRIAQHIGQEVIAIASNGGDSKQSLLGVKNINELLRRAEEIFR
ncbi:MAG: hypothetical protein IT174_06135 [Acidobacteria bacterium]|nr:hypothetical protein [Acidobacteriota bacterium]